MAHRDGAVGAAETVTAGPDDADLTAGQAAQDVAGPPVEDVAGDAAEASQDSPAAAGPDQGPDADATDGATDAAGSTGSADSPDSAPSDPDGAEVTADATTAPTADAPDASQVDEQAAEPAAEPAPASTGRRRLPRPSGPRTPAFGLTLGAIRGHRAAGGEGPPPSAAGGASRGTAELRRSLADKEAQTNELREALDALRQALDDTTTAPPARTRTGPDAEAPPRRRRGLWWVAAAAVLLLVVAVALATRGGGSTTATPTDTPSASGSPSAAGTPSASSAASTATTSPTAGASATPVPGPSTTPQTWGGTTVSEPPGLPTSGPGIDSPGTHVEFAVGADGQHLDVYESAVYAAPQTTVTFGLPARDVWDGAASLAAADPSVADLQVEIDGTAVTPEQQGTGWFALPPSGATASRVVLRYRLDGTVLRLAGSTSADRVLVGVPALTGRTTLESSLPLTVSVDDARVLSLSCLTTSGTTTCDSVDGTRFTATAPADAAPLFALSADVPKK